MFKSLFKKKSNNNQEVSEIGLHIDHPILMRSIPDSYAYLGALCLLHDGLSFQRIGSVGTGAYPKPIDQYEFTLTGRKFCTLYLYAYHTKSTPLIPAPFITLNPNADSGIFDGMNTSENDLESSMSGMYLLQIIIRAVLLKNGRIADSEVVWNEEWQETLDFALNKAGYEHSLELLILEEWDLYKSKNAELLELDFTDEFLAAFHHWKLVRYIPTYIQDRNQKIEKAFASILEAINRIQAWLDNETLRIRLESDFTSAISDYSCIKQATTSFCNINLSCDSIGRFTIAYEIDSRISEMISDDMSSTLIRRIYEFTSGEMEGFVKIISLNGDCIKIFERLLDMPAKDRNYEVITVERNAEESISTLLTKLELKDNPDEE